MQPTSNTTGNAAKSVNAANTANAGDAAAQQKADKSKIVLAKAFHSIISKVMDAANENANNQ